MTAIVLMCAGILGLFSPNDSEYEAASAAAGHDRDVGAHIKLAVWCEAHDMDTERQKHLQSALSIDPQNAAAHGMIGLVVYGGRWMSPEQVGEVVQGDKSLTAKLARYEEKRRAAPETAKAQWELALWCEKEGLKPEANAHLTAVTRLDPERTEAWHRLGYQFYHGHWESPEQAAVERAEGAVQAKADHHWQPFIEKWKRELVPYSTKRDLALSTLTSITDSRAVPSIRRVFCHGVPVEQMLGVEMLGKIDCPASSHALAGLALFGKSTEVKRAAIDALKGRDPRDFVDALIELMHHPLTYEVKSVGEHNQPGELIVEGEKSISRRIYKVPRVHIGASPYGPGYIVTSSTGLPRVFGPHHLKSFLEESPVEQVRRMAEYQRQAASYAQRAHSATPGAISKDVSKISRHNFEVKRTNLQVGSVLRQVTGESIAADPDAWNTWWADRIGYRYQYSQTPMKPTQLTYVRVRLASCFAAGTPVATQTGLRPIESLQIGDLVLSQDTSTGVLSYEPIVELHHNPPDTPLRIHLERETLVATTFHRFWRPGRGWVMARDLKPGDLIRTLTGRTKVLTIEQAPEQPVFNLDVAKTCTFFVGSQMELVHDNSLPPPVLTPFDAEPELASIVKGRATSGSSAR